MSKVYDLMKSIITRLKDVESNAQEKTAVDALVALDETDVVKPLADENNAILLDENGKVLIM